MDPKSTNPWEALCIDYSTSGPSEPSDYFNNIKLNDFPFLKSHLSSVDCLVKCKVCNVILLPETVYSHYEERHQSSSNSDGATVFLPYGAGYHLDDSSERNEKKNIGNNCKRSKFPNKRRRTNRKTDNLNVHGAMSETDSLSSLNDDSSKRMSSVTSEEEIDRLREPVLMKLAKSEYNIFERSKQAPVRAEPDTKKLPLERSVWSVVCSNQLVVDPSKPIPKVCSSSLHPNLESRALTSKPPGSLADTTASTSAPVLVASDLLNDFNKPGKNPRPFPGSESRSASGLQRGVFFSQVSSLMADEKFKRSGNCNSADRTKRSVTRPNKIPESALSNTLANLINDTDLTNSPDEQDGKRDLYSRSFNNVMEEKCTRSEIQWQTKKNGYNTRFIRPPNCDARANSSVGSHSFNSYSNKCRNERSLPEVYEYPLRSEVDRQSHYRQVTNDGEAYMWSCDAPHVGMSSRKQALPVTTGNFDYECTELGEVQQAGPMNEVHMARENHLVPRQKDLRILMREARDRLQHSRQSRNPVHRQHAPKPEVGFNMEETVIDLVGDSPPGNRGTSHSTADSEEARLELRLMSGERFMPSQRVVYHESPSFVFDDRMNRIHGSSNRSAGADCASSKLVRRLPHHTDHFGVYSAEMLANSPSCLSNYPEHVSEPLDDQMETMQLGADNPYLSGANSPSRFPDRFFPLGKRPTTVAAMAAATHRRPQRRQLQQARRSAHSFSQWGTQPLRRSSDFRVTPEHLEAYDFCATELCGTSSFVNNDTSTNDTYLSTHATSSATCEASPSSRHSVPILYPHAKQPFLMNQFSRPLRYDSQMIHEAQGRVVVEDMREKSITGRSRKVARSGARQPSSVYGASSLTGFFPSHLHHPVMQPRSAATFVATNRRPSSLGFLSAGASVVNRSLSGIESASRASASLPSAADSGATFRSSNSSPHTSQAFPTTSHGQPRRTDAFHVPQHYHSHDFVSSDDIGYLHVDRTIRPSAFDPAVSTGSFQPRLTTGGDFEPPDHSAASCSEPVPSSSAVSGSSSSASSSSSSQTFQLAVSDPGNSVGRNRYFVIRPNATSKPSPSLILRAKGPGPGCITEHTRTLPSGPSN